MTEANTKAGGTATPPSNRSPWQDVWRQYRAHKGAVAGAIIFLAIVATVAAGPFLWPYDASVIDIHSRNQGPGLSHPLGTD